MRALDVSAYIFLAIAFTAAGQHPARQPPDSTQPPNPDAAQSDETPASDPAAKPSVDGP